MSLGCVKEIPLTKGKVALVDAADFDWLSQWKWICTGRYAVRRRRAEDGPGGQLVMMHREILRPAEGLVGDHISGETLDNRRSNLRACTRGENALNKRTKLGATGFKGVSYLRATGKYRAHIQVNRRGYYSANFFTAIAAALAYDAMARELHGEFAVVNFPDHVMAWEWRPGTAPKAKRGFRALVQKAA